MSSQLARKKTLRSERERGRNERKTHSSSFDLDRVLNLPTLGVNDPNVSLPEVIRKDSEKMLDCWVGDELRDLIDPLGCENKQNETNKVSLASRRLDRSL